MNGSPPHAPPLPYRPDIDGLRAVAVLSVVGFHAFPDWIKGGYIGVDVFFVISGFLITSIILKNLGNGDFSFIGFYSRRIKRIFPAMILVLFVSLSVGWFVLLADEYKQLGKHIAGGTSFVSNFVLWAESGYFDDAAETKPLLHLWSLGIEEQYYVIWPLVLFLGWQLRFNILSTVLFILAVSFAINLGTLNSNPVAVFYSPLSRFWELLIGSMLAIMTSRQSPVLDRFKNEKSFVGIFMIGIGILLLNANSAFPGWWALLPTVGATLIISGGTESWLSRKVLANPLLVWFGIISYPLYLWHWPLLSMAHIVEGEFPSREIRLAAVFCSVALAWLTYRYVETHIRFKAQPLTTWLLIASGVILLILGIAAWQEIIKPRQHNKQLEKIVTAVEDWDYPSRGFDVLKYEGEYFYMKRASEPKVLFIGDSNIEQYGPRIDKVLSDNPSDNKSVIFATTGGCPPIPYVFERGHPDCQPRFNVARKLALRSDIETVVIGANWWLYFIKELEKQGAGGAGGYYFQHNGQKEFFKDGKGVSLALNALSDFLRFLADSNKKIVLILNSPTDDSLDPKTFYDGSRFGQLRFKPKASLFLKEFEKDYGALKDKLLSIGQRGGATVIDPLEHLCSDGICPGTMADGTPMYKDNGHLRAFYSRNYCDFIDPIVERF